LHIKWLTLGIPEKIENWKLKNETMQEEYPKRITVPQTQPHAKEWQEYFDRQYEALTK